MKNDQIATVSLRPEYVPSTAIGVTHANPSFRTTIATTTRRYIILATDGVP